MLELSLGPNGASGETDGTEGRVGYGMWADGTRWCDGRRILMQTEVPLAREAIWRLKNRVCVCFDGDTVGAEVNLTPDNKF